MLKYQSLTDMGKKIIIIGGGVAGLTAGIYGQRHGFNTEIIEMHTVPGGQCTAWNRKGYRFDYCLHWLVGTAKGPFHEIWRDTDVLNDQVEILNHDVHTRILAEDGSDFIIYTNIDRWEKYLTEMAPEDAKTIRKMCNDMRKGIKLEPFLNPPGLRKPGEYLKALVKMFPALKVIAQNGRKTCREYFAERKFKNQKLAFYLDSIFGDEEFSALAFLLMLAWFNQRNAGYIIGGSLPLANRMADCYLSLGGKFSLGKKVETIVVEGGKARGVTLADGTVLKADYVISAADGRSTLYSMLGGRFLPPSVKKAYDSWKLFTPLVQVSFGISKPIPEKFPVMAILAKGKTIGSTTLKNNFVLMNYSFDPTMAPEGKTVIVLRYESPWEIWQNLDGVAYKEEKERIMKEAVSLLEQHHPGIGDFIEVTDVATPKTTVRYTGVWNGSYEGFIPAAKNFGKTLDMTLPGLDNFYMAGQWIYPGGGLPPSAQSGKWAIQLICKKEKL